MRGIHWYALLLMLASAATPAAALQLHWSTGSNELTFTNAIRCTLVVQADTSEGRLPSEWRLVWAADSVGISPVSSPPGTSCLNDVADVSTVLPPSTTAEATENLLTARFCAASGEPVTTARLVFDLPGGKRGKFRAVALDPTDPDSSRVVQTDAVTFNGGVATAFPPVVFRTSTVHRSTAFQLKVVGAGLAGASDLVLAAPDASWRVPLAVANQGETSIDATASLAANVPASVLQVTGGDGAVAVADVSSDPPPPPLEPLNGGCVRRFEEVLDPNDPYMIQPKDFAFVSGAWTPSGSWAFHLFYIRRNQRIGAKPNGGDLTEKNLGHVVSNDLANWYWPRSQALDTMAVRTRGGRFDSLHVWAPTILRKTNGDPTFYMLYTGVDEHQNQRIGLATSMDLISWTQGDSVLTVQQLTAFADPSPDSLYGGAAQLRDPFVVEDPNVFGDYLMYFVTVQANRSPEMVVGVARSHGNFSSWVNPEPIWATSHGWPNPFGSPRPTAFVVESPHVFYREGKWWLFSTVNQDSVWAQSNANAAGPSDTTSTHWTGAQKLWTLVPPDQAGWFYYWHATEYLRMEVSPDVEYLAAFTDDIVGISYTQMRPADAPFLFSMDCPTALGVGNETATVLPRLLITGARPSRAEVALRIELPVRTRATVAIYDVLGRRLRTLVDDEFPAGGTDLSWDGRDRSGMPVASGVYFVGFSTQRNHQSVRVPLIR